MWTQPSFRVHDHERHGNALADWMDDLMNLRLLKLLGLRRAKTGDRYR